MKRNSNTKTLINETERGEREFKCWETLPWWEINTRTFKLDQWLTLQFIAKPLTNTDLNYFPHNCLLIVVSNHHLSWSKKCGFKQNFDWNTHTDKYDMYLIAIRMKRITVELNVLILWETYYLCDSNWLSCKTDNLSGEAFRNVSFCPCFESKLLLTNFVCNSLSPSN